MKSKILIVDDEPDVLDLIEFNLKASGFDVAVALDGEEALVRAREHAPSLIILDLMLPGGDGYEVCTTLRSDPTLSAIPIIMVTAKAGESDRVMGLELGADDYVTKPFSPRELVLRVKNLLRRRSPQGDHAERLQVGEVVIDISRHVVSVQGRPVDLTLTEFRLLALLLQQRGRVQSREQLLRGVWQLGGTIDARTVDAHIRRLREKLGGSARCLHTVRGFGYRFAEDPEAPTPFPRLRHPFQPAPETDPRGPLPR